MENPTRKFYPLRDDFVFKIVFGKEGNEPLLSRLIDALLHFEGDRCIAELQLLNPFNLKETPDDKFTIVDVKARDRSGRRFTIEMQARSQEFFARRMMYYLALLYAQQLTSGAGYDQLLTSYGIAILNDVLLPDHPHFEAHFRYRETGTGLILPDLPELHFVELPKYHDRPSHLRNRLEKWLHVLKFSERYAAGEDLPEDIRAEEEIFMTVEETRRVSRNTRCGPRRQGVNADARMRAILEQREKEEHIRITELHVAEQRGEAKGIEKGIEKGREEGREIERRKALAEKQEAVIMVLEARFQQIPQTVVAAVKSIENPDTLQNLLRTAVVAQDLNGFQEELTP